MFKSVGRVDKWDYRIYFMFTFIFCGSLMGFAFHPIIHRFLEISITPYVLIFSSLLVSGALLYRRIFFFFLNLEMVSGRGDELGPNHIIGIYIIQAILSVILCFILFIIFPIEISAIFSIIFFWGGSMYHIGLSGMYQQYVEEPIKFVLLKKQEDTK